MSKRSLKSLFDFMAKFAVKPMSVEELFDMVPNKDYWTIIDVKDILKFSSLYAKYFIRTENNGVELFQINQIKYQKLLQQKKTDFSLCS